jgi:hypothetical protein
VPKAGCTLCTSTTRGDRCPASGTRYCCATAATASIARRVPLLMKLPLEGPGLPPPPPPLSPPPGHPPVPLPPQASAVPGPGVWGLPSPGLSCSVAGAGAGNRIECSDWGWRRGGDGAKGDV